MATVGGAQCLKIDDVVGCFDVGKEFDAVLVNTAAGSSSCWPKHNRSERSENPAAVDQYSAMDIFASDSLLDAFQKYVNLADDRHVARVWVRGKCVHSK